MPAQESGSLIEPLDTTKAGLRAYLDEAAITTKSPFHGGAAMRVAVLRFILDSARIHDPLLRKAIGRQFLATPGWFASNASAARQAYDVKSTVAQIEEDVDI